MRKIALYSGLLILGLVLSQALPLVLPGPWAAAHEPVKLATMFCLAFIMVQVGFEFAIDKTNMRQYAWDYAVAATAAAFPWLFCAGYFVWAMSPEEAWSSWDAWKQALLVGRFSAPTSAGILFSMLAAAGLTATWVFKKARILAIFDDLDTVLLMIPLKIMLVGMKWQLAALGAGIMGMMWLAWRYLNTRLWPASWPWVMGYAAAVTAACEFVFLASVRMDASVPIHLEVLLPAFAMGCVVANHPDHGAPAERRAAGLVTAAFLVLVGLSMPPLKPSALALANEPVETLIGAAWPGWGVVAKHVVWITVLSNLGKMFSLLCYRAEASWKERLAVSIAMWPRGEVGAGVLVISLSYGLSGTVVTVAMLSLALNLACTGLFIAAVKALIVSQTGPLPNDEL